jgi:hypothetical protein
MDKDSKLFGFVIGCIIPVLAYIAIDQIFELLSSVGIMANVSGEGISRRLRTVGLLAICTNLLAFNWAKNNRYDATMQGIVFPTIIYVVAWIYTYYHVLF